VTIYSDGFPLNNPFSSKSN